MHTITLRFDNYFTATLRTGTWRNAATGRRLPDSQARLCDCACNRILEYELRLRRRAAGLADYERRSAEIFAGDPTIDQIITRYQNQLHDLRAFNHARGRALAALLARA